MSTNTVQHISDWSFTQVAGGKGTADNEWLKVAQFPTTVHVELLRLGRIPDPVRRTLFDHLPKVSQSNPFSVRWSE